MTGCDVTDFMITHFLQSLNLFIEFYVVSISNSADLRRVLGDQMMPSSFPIKLEFDDILYMVRNRTVMR